MSIITAERPADRSRSGVSVRHVLKSLAETPADLKPVLKPKKYGVYTLIGTFLLVLAGAIWLGGFPRVYESFLAFAVNPAGVENGGNNLWEFFTWMLPVVVVDIAISITLLLIISAFIGKHKGEHGVSKIMFSQENTSMFKKFFLLVFIEEAFARGLLLGLVPAVLGKIPGLYEFAHGNVVFYAMFLLGNAVWAWVHLANYKNKEDHHWLRIVPQFAGGILFTFMFVKWGFVGAILTHFACNAVLFAGSQIQRICKVDFMILALNAVGAVVFFLLLDENPLDFVALLNGTAESGLEGWGFWDFLLLSAGVGFAMHAVADLLFFDRSNLESYSKKIDLDPKLRALGFGILAVAPLALPLFFAMLLSLLSEITAGYTFAALISAIVVCALVRHANSVGASTRTFFAAVPTIMVLIIACDSLGYWASVPFLCCMGLICVPKVLLKHHDD